MRCEKCNSDRVASISGKCRDSFYCTIKNKEYDGYVLDGIGVGRKADGEEPVVPPVQKV